MESALSDFSVHRRGQTRPSIVLQVDRHDGMGSATPTIEHLETYLILSGVFTLVRKVFSYAGCLPVLRWAWKWVCRLFVG